MLTPQNIEAELSYAYLHAVAGRAGFGCEYTTRHVDAASVDAIIREDGRLLVEGGLASFALHIQLKATVKPLRDIGGRWAYSLPIRQYNRLRETRVMNPQILVVLQLPPNPEEWLQHFEEALVSRRCAYWVSLRAAPASDNDTAETVYLPREQTLSPESLTVLMTRFSQREVIDYVP